MTEEATKATKVEETQYLTFHLGDEVFGIGILHVKEIKEFSDLTVVPMMPVFIPGVINLRGNVVPIIDINYLFFKKLTTITRKTCIIILEVINSNDNEKMEVGLLVDSVSQVIDIPPAEVKPAPSFGAKIRTDFISGIGKYDNDFIILLNIKKIVSLDDITRVLEETESFSEKNTQED